MPPSGFGKQAISGLLIFVKDIYTQTLDKYEGKNLSEQAVLEESIAYLDGLVQQSARTCLDGTFSEEGIKGLAQFVTANFRDLIKEIQIGKKTEGQAMSAEIKDIGEYLLKFSLH